MKKIIAFVLSMAMLFALSCTIMGCDSKEQLKLSADIYFCKNMEGEKYDTKTFDINTMIYVYVDIDVKNTESYKEAGKAVIDFEIALPYADYYSAHDLAEGGDILPDETQENREINGETVSVTKLTGLQFNVDIGKDSDSKRVTYVFQIRAKQKCNNMAFEVTFSSKDDKIKFDRTDFSETYSFVDKENEE